MKKIHLLICFISITISTSAQNIGIGTTSPDASAKLDVTSTSAGMLVPRMNSAQRTSITAPAQGLLVYDTDTNTFWFYNASAWTNLSLSGSSGWSLSGNSGTNPTTNFIGTTDNVPFNVRVNNQKAGRIDNTLFNTFWGYQAGNSNTTGGYNTANGYQALYSNTTGIHNTANGYQALYSNSIGSYNTANGSKALYSNKGWNNTANGNQALYDNTDGDYNTAIGHNALLYNTGGNQNIAIGYNSGTHSSTPNVYNTIGIGNDGSFLNAYQNQVIIGNSSTLFIGGKVNWGIVSDARIKNTITEDVKGLDFISRLRPVTYYISNKAITAITGNKETPDFPGKYDGEKVKYSGFLAQEVEQAAKSSGYDFSGYDTPKNQWGLYTIKYAEFVVPLVKAVQEQQVMIDFLQKQVEAVKAEIPIQIGEQQQMIEDQKRIIDGQQTKIDLILKRLTRLEEKAAK